MSLYFGLMVLGWVAMPALALAQQPTLPLSKMTEDVYRVDLPVKGEYVVGVVADANRKQVGVTLPNVYIPAGISGMLCLRIASQDGRFFARAEYVLNSPDPKTYALAFQSVHREFQDYKISDL